VLEAQISKMSIRVHHVGISSADPGASVAFFCGVLGCEREPDGPGGVRSVRLGGATLAISALGEGEGARPHGDHLALALDATLDAIVRRLRAHEIEFQYAPGRVYVRDPGGYVVELVAAQ
jgi:catechol 2,3-dioxygenase-like lactoylglutathione lyase family enzyme